MDYYVLYDVIHIFIHVCIVYISIYIIYIYIQTVHMTYAYPRENYGDLHVYGQSMS